MMILSIISAITINTAEFKFLNDISIYIYDDDVFKNGNWRIIMPKYIIMSNLTDEGAKTLKKNAGRIKEVNAELKSMGVNVIDQYAILGNFDFITIVDAEDDNMVMKAVIAIASRGSIKTETYKAVPIDEFIESLK